MIDRRNNSGELTAPEGKVCPHCQHLNKQDDNFCTHCGLKLIFTNDACAKLCILSGEPMGATFLLRQGRTTIGHDCGNIIVIGDEHISNKHAIITYESGGYWIEDRQSKNGVYLNGNRVRDRQLLVEGSVIKMGETVFKFEI
jgi:hypothetical protein